MSRNQVKINIGLKYTKILEVNLFAFAYRLFHEDFSSIDGALQLGWSVQYYLQI